MKCEYESGEINERVKFMYEQTLSYVRLGLAKNILKIL
jgi:hypothetical protein